MKLTFDQSEYRLHLEIVQFGIFQAIIGIKSMLDFNQIIKLVALFKISTNLYMKALKEKIS